MKIENILSWQCDLVLFITFLILYLTLSVNPPLICSLVKSISDWQFCTLKFSFDPNFGMFPDYCIESVPLPRCCLWTCSAMSRRWGCAGILRDRRPGQVTGRRSLWTSWRSTSRTLSLTDYSFRSCGLPMFVILFLLILILILQGDFSLTGPP